MDEIDKLVSVKTDLDLLILVDSIKDFNFWLRPTAPNVMDPNLEWSFHCHTRLIYVSNIL